MKFGGGGHSREILSRLGDGGRLLGFDQDEDAERNIVNDPHFTFVRSNFRYLHNFLRYHGIEQVEKADEKAAAEQAEEAAEAKPKRAARKAEEASKAENEAPAAE